MTDQPPPGAARFLELFEEGKRFTEDLLRENERLRLVITKLRDELDQRSRGAQPPVAADNALEREVSALRDELASLRRQFSSVEQENRQFAERYVRLERQNSDLIAMYVATYRLHSTLDFGEVVRTVKEIVINLVGSEAFGIYLVDQPTQMLKLIAHEGLEGGVPASIAIGDGILGQAAATGQLYVAPPTADLNAGGGVPIAAVPLKTADHVIGLIGIFRLLVQKDTFGSVDYELFELLGGHAATALYAANLYTVSERKRSTLEGFIDLLKSDVRPPA